MDWMSMVLALEHRMNQKDMIRMDMALGRVLDTERGLVRGRRPLT